MTEVQQIANQLTSAGLGSEDLDDAVLREMERRASTVNSKGMTGQVTFLLDSDWSVVEILESAKGEV